MTDTVDGGQDILGSKLPAKNGYGQNGFSGASSDLPGKRTKRSASAGVAPPDPKPSDIKSDWQTRPVSAAQKVPTTRGARNVNANPVKVPAANSRRSK